MLAQKELIPLKNDKNSLGHPYFSQETTQSFSQSQRNLLTWIISMIKNA